MKSLIKSQLKRFGWELRRATPPCPNRRALIAERNKQRWAPLFLYSPRTVLDIGANKGQFAKLARTLSPAALIVAFEPLSDCFSELSLLRNELSPLECFNVALGDKTGTATINRSHSSPSSSLLPMEDLHTSELPHTRYISQETIITNTLDNIVQNLELPLPIVAKIDVQGYEEPVLLGGAATLRNCAAITIEISMAPLYRGEANFDRIYTHMKSMGFRFAGILDQWRSRDNSRILQADCLFEQEPSKPTDTPYSSAS